MWRCSDAACEATGPSAAVLEQEAKAILRAMAGTLQLAELDACGWHGHWARAAALWSGGIARLRGGVERGDRSLARSGWPLLEEYFAWVRQRHRTRPHVVSAQACRWRAPKPRTGSRDRPLPRPGSVT